MRPELLEGRLRASEDYRRLALRQMDSTLFTLRQAVQNIEREIAADPPFSAANQERRGELDQLRDMMERRT